MTKSAEKKQTTMPIDETRELGFETMLVAESEEGGYEPVAR